MKRSLHARFVVPNGRGAIPLFRLGRTLVAVHASFILVILGAIWLGVAQYGTATGALFNVLAVLLLFVCVLIHELAHTLVARRYGIEVHDILLLPIGGVANMEAVMIPPSCELRIALAGPVSNLLLGALLFLIIVGAAVIEQQPLGRVIMRGLRAPSPIGLMAYLSAANLVLGVFNLLPAFPLDGGRALRAILCRGLTFEAATFRAAIVGRSFGAGMMAVAVGLMLVGMLPLGISLAIVAYVLYSEATYEWNAVRSQVMLHRWTAGEVATMPTHVANPNQPLYRSLDAILMGNVILVVIGEHAKLVGMVTSADVRKRQGKIRELSIAHVMTTEFAKVQASDPLWIAHEKLKRFNLSAIPVVTNDDLKGLVTLADIQRVLRENAPSPQRIQ